MSKFVSFTEIGPRQSNEDRLLLPITRGNKTLMAIADGVGGAAGGGLAAELAVNTLSERFNEDVILSDLFGEIVGRLKEKAEENETYKKMATTLSAVVIEGDTLNLCHVGDTRVYHLRDGGLVTITQDQTEIAELLRKGILTRKQAERYSRKNVLLYALSPSDDYEIYQSQAQVKANDRILLVSDGVYNRVHKSELAKLSHEHADLEQFMDALRRTVIEFTARDNFTALAYELG